MYVFRRHFASYNFSDMLSQLIGRTKERATLLKALTSPEPEMVAVIGRRRVGKTFLVRSVYEATAPPLPQHTHSAQAPARRSARQRH